jgi:hypothetical protein
LDDGNLYHMIRRANGSWTALGDVRGATRTSVPMVETAGAVTFGQLHVLGVDREAGLWHSIRLDDGGWTGFTAVLPFTGNPGPVRKVAAAASLNGDLHVLAITDWELAYTVRHNDGSWEPFRPIHPVHPDADPPLEVAAVMDSWGLLHVVVLGSDFSPYHRVRYENGTWSPFGDLGIPPSEALVDVAIAASRWDVHVAIVTRHPNINVPESGVYHRIRYSGGPWTPWGAVGVPPGQHLQIGATGFFHTDEVQLTVSDVYGKIYHILRRADWSWTQWGALLYRSFGGDVEMASER